jgi:hypothetical protein
VGSHTITASFSGSGWTPSQGTVTQTIVKAPAKLVAAPGSKGLLGLGASFSATLTRPDTGAAIGGQTVVFSTRNLLGGQDAVCAATTSGAGVAACKGTIPLLDALLDSSYTATFAGGTDYLPSTATGKLG